MNTQDQLNTDTVVSCLNDEREAIIEKLIDNDLRAIDKGSDLLRQVLTWGWEGYENMETIELRDEIKLRGLEV